MKRYKLIILVIYNWPLYCGFYVRANRRLASVVAHRTKYNESFDRNRKKNQIGFENCIPLIRYLAEDGERTRGAWTWLSPYSALKHTRMSEWIGKESVNIHKRWGKNAPALVPITHATRQQQCMLAYIPESVFILYIRCCTYIYLYEINRVWKKSRHRHQQRQPPIKNR